MKFFFAFAFVVSLQAVAQEMENLSSAPADAVLSEPTQRSMSQALYFPGAGMNQITVQPILSRTESTYTFSRSGSTGSEVQTEQTTRLAYDYGFSNKDLAIGLATGFGSKTHETDSNGKYNFSGMEDLTLKIQGLSRLQDTQMIYGALVSTNLSDSKFAYKNESGTINSGGSALTPFAGIEMATSFGSAGGQVSYKIKGDRKIYGRAGEVETTTGGNEMILSLFSEKKFVVNSMGLTGSYTSRQAGSIDSTEDGKEDYIGLNYWQVTGYGRIEMNSVLSLMPMATFNQILTKDFSWGSYDKRDTTTYSLAGLVTF